MVGGNANIIDMQKKYLALLPDDLQQRVLETEQAIGFQVEVVVDPNRARGIPGEADPMACKVEVGFARVLVAAADQFRPCSVFHELLHIRRFLVEGIPKLVICKDYEPWTPEIEKALVKHDNAFEHLVIVPLELQAYPEGREHWEGVMARVWEDIEAGRDDEVARRQMGLASWAFLQRVLPDSAAIPRARAILQASNDFEHAERFCETLFPLLGDKAVAIRAWFEFLNVPLEMVSLKYWEPLDLRTHEVPLGR